MILLDRIKKERKQRRLQRFTRKHPGWGECFGKSEQDHIRDVRVRRARF